MVRASGRGDFPVPYRLDFETGENRARSPAGQPGVAERKLDFPGEGFNGEGKWEERNRTPVVPRASAPLVGQRRLRGEKSVARPVSGARPGRDSNFILGGHVAGSLEAKAADC